MLSFRFRSLRPIRIQRTKFDLLTFVYSLLSFDLSSEMSKNLIKMGDDDEVDTTFYSMSLEKNRLASFKDWPLPPDCNCTPEKLAEAGFYHTPNEDDPDSVCCFACQKELDGWEPSDDPWTEHASHTRGGCPFITKNLKETEMTVKDFLELEVARLKLRLTKAFETQLLEFKQYAGDVRSQLLRLREQ